MISLLTPQALPVRFIRISEVLRRYAYQQGMEEKTKEFAEAGAEVELPA